MDSKPPRDVAQLRLDNALRLFDEFVAATVKHPDAATLRGLERRFAERLQVQPSYWSQIKSRSRQIGERLARQFEQQCHKPWGWMDQPHDPNPVAPLPPGEAIADPPAVPRDDDERFIIGLVLTYYRRHPQKARQRLLDLLGEVLTPAPEPLAGPPAANAAPAAPKPTPKLAPGVVRPGAAAASPPPPVDDHSLWAGSQSGVAPLAPRKRR